ncbi:hypothetical protein [Cohnella abietis]|uniref:Uncharacterized protein n=1 Tax=Cohnella abietis TaxID=2507935 RepID=A0A3T1CXY2_9BACL|nr:hypothetical protein [Cohnella abietis]BBI30727.1 hypothetical protein KCTCHS21_01260 [Cohnella abietis]
MKNLIGDGYKLIIESSYDISEDWVRPTEVTVHTFNKNVDAITETERRSIDALELYILARIEDSIGYFPLFNRAGSHNRKGNLSREEKDRQDFEDDYQSRTRSIYLPDDNDEE